MDAHDDTARRDGARGALGAFLGGAAALAVLGALLPGQTGLDAWYHARYADLLRRGVARWDGSVFPWQTHSAYADLPMDWSLGWHWIVAPLTAFGALAALRIATCIGVGLLAAAFHSLLRAAGVRPAWPWTLLLVVGNAGWLYRELLGRPTPFVIAVLFVLLGAVVRGRAAAAGALAFLAMALYHVVALPLLVGGCGCAAVAAVERRVPWRVAAAGLLGVGLAILAHPGFHTLGPDGTRATFHLWALMRGSLDFAAVNGTVVFPGRGEIVVPLPAELFAAGPGAVLAEMRVPLFATLLAVIWSVTALVRRRADPWAVATAALAAATCAATLRSGRFFEYWHPLAVAAGAVAGARMLEASAAAAPPRTRGALVAASALLVVGEAPRYAEVLREAEVTGAGVEHACAVLLERAAPGDIVWHGSWDDFAPLFHFAPELRFLTGFDPYYLVAHDPEDVLHHAAAQAGAFDDTALRESLQTRFGARFVVLWKRWGRAERYASLEAQLRRVPWAEVFDDEPEVVVFELRAW